MNGCTHTSQALPGFEELVKTAIDRAGSPDLQDKRYTAAMVLRDYPETFKSAAAAIFKYNLPNRVIRDLFRMNGATVKGIHDMVMGAASRDGRGGFLMKCRAASTKSIVISRLLDTIVDKLDDPKVIAEMSVAELTSILKQLSPPEPTQAKDDAKRIDVQVVEPGEDFESVINGLVAEKIRAPRQVDEGDAADGGECSTCNGFGAPSSYQMSNIRSNSLSKSGGLCNDLCNQSADGADGADSPARVPVAPTSAEAPRGAGGPRGRRARGGVN